jgi:hypothetical protein
MSKRKSLKEIITEAVITELPSNYHDVKTTPVDNLLIRWWRTGRQNGLQLTEYGDQMFRIAEIEFYQYELKLQPEIQYQAWVLELSKKIKCPYYIGVNKDGKKNHSFIRLYDSKIAMMISLYGNVNDYLNSIKVKK